VFVPLARITLVSFDIDTEANMISKECCKDKLISGEAKSRRKLAVEYAHTTSRKGPYFRYMTLILAPQDYTEALVSRASKPMMLLLHGSKLEYGEHTTISNRLSKQTQILRVVKLQVLKE
jgi:hypothetical protein